MKISIIGGAGRVGSHIAYALLLRDIPIDEVILQDVVDSVEGEAMDLQQAAAALGKKTAFRATKEIADCAGSDITVIAAGIPLSKAKTMDRYQTLDENIKILSSILEKVSKNPGTVYIIITNPVDVITYFLAKKIGNRKKAIGISTLTDTARMNTLSEGYLIGEHAGVMIPVNGNVDVGKVKELGSKVIDKKGGTWFATPIGITSIIKSIVNDEKKDFPVSTFLEGEYGLNGVCVSVPCIIGKQGIEEIKEVQLDEKQKELLNKAAESVKSKIKEVEGHQTK